MRHFSLFVTAMAILLAVAAGARVAQASEPAYLPDVAHSEGLEAAAESGEPRAEFELATAYYMGEGVSPSDKEAMTWAKRAMANGEIHAACIVGVLELEKGQVSGINHLLIGAEAGFGRCQEELASAFAKGADAVGIAANPEAALRFYARCAQLGRASCQNETARSLLIRSAKKHDAKLRQIELAEVWLRIAAANPENDECSTTRDLLAVAWRMRVPSRAKAPGVLPIADTCQGSQPLATGSIASGAFGAIMGRAGLKGEGAVRPDNSSQIHNR